jgi:hypothetical protein
MASADYEEMVSCVSTVCPQRTHRATTPPSLGPVVDDWRRITVLPRLSVRQGPRAFPLTLCSTALIMVMWLAEMTRQGAVAVRFLGGVSAKLPLDVALLRLPGDLLAEPAGGPQQCRELALQSADQVVALPCDPPLNRLPQATILLRVRILSVG